CSDQGNSTPTRGSLVGSSQVASGNHALSVLDRARHRREVVTSRIGRSRGLAARSPPTVTEALGRMSGGFLNTARRVRDDQSRRAPPPPRAAGSANAIVFLLLPHGAPSGYGRLRPLHRDLAGPEPSSRHGVQEAA